MILARAILLLMPIFYAVTFAGKNITQLLNDSLFYHLYYMLAFFDLLCFVELYFVKKQVETDPQVSTTWSFLLTILIAQVLTLNAMSVGTLLFFLYQNRNEIKLKEKLKSITSKARMYLLLNAAVLGGALALFYFMLSIYVSTRN